jgi:two-component system OmpR family sensor kinase
VSEPRRIDVLAHELRSPVAALGAIADAAGPLRADPERARRLLELAVAAGRNIERLVTDAAFMSIEPREADLAAVAAEAVEAWRLAGRTVVLAASAPVVALVDPHRIRQAVDNLVGNALGHSPEGAEVTVEVEGGDGTATIAVVDRGEGIAPEDQPRVFDAGVRLTDARPGSGIGLAVVRAVAEAHGGRVELVSAPGAGSTFRLVLPRGGGAAS